MNLRDELAEKAARLEKLEEEFHLCSLGDRPHSPSVRRMLEAEQLREDVDALRQALKAATPQPPPAPSNHPAVADLVQADLRARDEMGAAKYGTRLRPHDGRDSLMDAYQEALDQAFYLRKALYERDGR